jgi:hypothetical protein
MPREILRLFYPIAEIVSLEYPGERYRVEFFWRVGRTNISRRYLWAAAAES